VRAQNLNLIGIHLRVRGELTAAVAYLREAIAIVEKEYGRRQVIYCTVASNLAGALCEIGEYKEARAMYERVMSCISRGIPKDEDAARALTSYGLLLYTIGDSKGARKKHERALRLATKVVGETHPSLGLYLNNLGLSVKGVGEYELA